jgi:hypothetical protein
MIRRVFLFISLEIALNVFRKLTIERKIFLLTAV